MSSHLIYGTAPTTDGEPMDTTNVTRYLALLYLFAAAREGATYEQVEKLRAIPPMLKDPSIHVATIVKAIIDVRGLEWEPDEKWVRALEALA